MVPPLYHRAECLTHVGDSQAVRSLTQCGEPMRFAMAAPIDLRNDFDSVSLRRLAKRTRDATQSRRLLALARSTWWQQDGCVADRRRRSANRNSRLGAALQRPRTGRAGRWEEHRAHPRSSTPITAAHLRRLLRPARSRRSTASCAGGARPGAVALGDVRHLARRDHGRARVEGARLRQDLGAAAPLRAKRAGRRGF